MKTRYGFVSNSSSSSFIIAFKGDEKEMRDKLSSIFEIQLGENYPIKSMLPIGDVIADNVEDSIKTLNEWKNYYGNPNNPDEEYERFIKRLKEGWTIYTGSIPDDRNKLSTFLCNSDIEYEDDNLIIWQRGGY